MPIGVYIHKKASLETRKKMSLAHSGSKNHFFGKTHTEEVKKKLSILKEKNPLNYWLGKKRPPFSLETRIKMSTAHKGNKSHHWRGGLTKLSKIIRNSAEYKRWRIAVFERDNFTCQFCGVRGGNLEADHIKPFALFPELRFAIDNGRTLCRPCHKGTDTWGSKKKIIG